MFEVLYRHNNEEPWEVYGRFNNEREWDAEIPHINFLREMRPLYLKRRKVEAN